MSDKERKKSSGQLLMEQIKAMPTDDAIRALFYTEDGVLYWNVTTPPFREKGREVKADWTVINDALVMSKQEIVNFLAHNGPLINTADRFITRDQLPEFIRKQKEKQELEREANAGKSKSRTRKKDRQQPGSPHVDGVSESVKKLNADLMELSKAISVLKGQISELSKIIPR